MQEDTAIKDELIRRLLAAHEELMRENSKLREASASDKDEEILRLKNMLAEKDVIINTQDEELKAKNDVISKKDDLLEKRDVKIAKLTKQVEYLTRQMFGGKSERFINPDPDARQLDLFEGVDLLPGEKEAATLAEKEIKMEKEARMRRKKASLNKPVRRTLPDNLERKIEHVYPEGYNQDEWELMDGAEPLYTEVLVKEPAKFYVLRTYRHKAIRKADKKIVTADCPMKPIARSYASASLLADLMIGKYVDHIPFYRQIRQFERLGLQLSESTIVGWFQEVSDLLMPLYFRLWELIKKSDYLQCDETSLPVVRDERHKTVRGYLWLVREVMSGRQFFYWDKGSRAALVALKLFHGYQGAIQTDGHPLYEQLDGKKGIILLGCLAHARRKFEESLKNDEERASHALAEIQLVYDVERQIKDQNLSYKEAAELRARLAYPILVRFEKWMVAEHPKLLKGSPIEAAIQYTYKRFDKLTRYHLDGRYHIDNNACERGMRPVAQGRSAYLFCKNDDTAESTAILYSFMGCCRAAGVDFRKWMIYFLELVHQYDDDYSKDLDELLPDNLKAAGVL